MNIVVTGADGFIGSHLVDLLLKDGHTVLATELFGSDGTDLDEGHERLQILATDVRETAWCPPAQVDVFFHLAALGSVPHSMMLPNTYLQTNIGGTFNVAMAAISCGARMILMSTSEVYGGYDTKINEFMPRHPRSIYAASKVAAEAVVEACMHMYGLRGTIVRGFNTYGPRQNPRAIIAHVCGQLTSETATQIDVGELSTERDLVYVGDMVAALASLIHEDVDADIGPYNICTGETHKMEDVITMLKEIAGRDLPVVVDESRVRGPWDVQRLHGVNDKFKLLTGWEPTTDLKTGLSQTLEFWKEI